MNRVNGVRDVDQVPDECYASLGHWGDHTVFHSRGWHRVLTRAFGWKVRARVIVDQGGVLRGFLPYVRKRRLGRLVHVSLPLSHRAGIVGEAGLPLADLDLVDPTLPFEIHADQPIEGTRPTVHDSLSEIDLSRHASEDELLSAFQSDVRRRLRKAADAGITSRDRSDLKAFEVFADLQSLTRRRQGSPTYPKDFFRILGEELGSDGTAMVHLVEVAGRPVAGTVFLTRGDTAIYAYGASVPDRELWRLGVNQVALSEGIRQAWRRGMRTVDLGSSPLSQPSLKRYKEHFGASSRDLVYRVTVSSDGEMSIPQDGLLARAGGAVLRRTPMPIFRTCSPWLLKAVV